MSNKKMPEKNGSKTKEWAYKDKPVLGFFAEGDGKRAVISFGWRKAALILGDVDALKAFVTKHQPKEAPAS
ncbi:MAG: hypothetical protein ABIH23_36165 [bacterium]